MFGYRSWRNRQGVGQNRPKKVFKTALRLHKGLDILKFDKNSTIYSASYFNFGWHETLLGGISPPNRPRGDGLGQGLTPPTGKLNVKIGPLLSLYVGINMGFAFLVMFSGEF